MLRSRNHRIVHLAVTVVAAALVLSCFDFEENQIRLTFDNKTDVDLCYYPLLNPPTHVAEFCARISPDSETVWSYGCGPGDLTTKSPVAITITETASGAIISEHVGDCSEWLESPPTFTITRLGGEFRVDQQ